MSDWLDRRTGYRRLVSWLLYESIPGGARWRYVWGSTLIFTFLLQILTGFLLWTAYSPSIRSAWESVYFIQHQMELGWFIRGLHHYASHAMIVLLVFHLVQVVIAGAYRSPREINWWFGMLLLGLVLGTALTGYLLPWDERGYWATQVTTKILGIVPLMGPTLERLLLGGPTYGHHTLTRFFALHAGILPALLVLATVLHVVLFRRHGVTHPGNAKGEDYFWPRQALLDGIACLAVMVVLAALAGWGGWERGFVFGPEGGAPLDAPADPSRPSPSARPEWYLLFLYQFLKYFPGRTEVIGAVVIPSVVVGVMLCFPFLGRIRRGHALCVGITVATLTGALLLTVTAVREDQTRPMYLAGLAEAEKKARRVLELASENGIPPGGALAMLHRDPQTQGPPLFRDNCSACHRWDGHDGTGAQVTEVRNGESVAVGASASDLAGFGTPQWVAEFLRDPASERFFGKTRHREGTMVQWSRKNIPLMTEREIEAVSAFVIHHAGDPEPAVADPELMALGARVFSSGTSEGAQGCILCHQLDHPEVSGSGMALGPDLTGYGSPEWLGGIIKDSSQPRFYGNQNSGMPKFAHRLRNQELQLLTDWILAENPTGK